ncbi:MAG: LacI family transcriptional regulator [Paludibacter sp. 47-17]|nr:MAG: LacI family transcriptional regulator [Paludibacter sp. 47-17]
MSLHKTTIKDIAKELGISVATVSRALTGSHEVQEETREMVLRKAKELNYRPNIQARNLLKNRTNIIGVIVPEFVSFFFPEIIIGIQEVANREDYQVLICQSNETSDLERKNIEMLESSRVEGIIVSVTKESKNEPVFERLLNEQMPLVFINRVLPDLIADKVIIDDRKWAFKAVEHLIKCGYRRIAHLGGNEKLAVSANRLQGYLDAHRHYGLDVHPNLIMNLGVQQERASLGVNYLLSLKVKPDAVFCVNDPVAVGCMLELKKRGLKVPEDIAVVGFSESPIGRIMELTSVSQPTYEMGRVAAGKLLEQIKGNCKPAETVVLDAKLNIRNSSLPVHKRTQK